MKRENAKYLFVSFLIAIASLSCKSKNVYKNGDVVVMDNDTFDVVIDTHRIIEVTKVPARNVLEEASPKFLIRTDLDSTYTSPNPRKIGDFQIYQTFIKRK